MGRPAPFAGYLPEWLDTVPAGARWAWIALCRRAWERGRPHGWCSVRALPRKLGASRADVDAMLDAGLDAGDLIRSRERPGSVGVLMVLAQPTPSTRRSRRARGTRGVGAASVAQVAAICALVPRGGEPGARMAARACLDVVQETHPDADPVHLLSTAIRQMSPGMIENPVVFLERVAILLCGSDTKIVGRMAQACDEPVPTCAE